MRPGLIVTLCMVLLSGGCARADVAADLERIRLPAGFSIAVWARVPGARSLAVAPELGAVFVGTRDDRVFAVVDRDRDGAADEAFQVASGLKVPNGVAWRDGHLYVVEQHRLLRMPVAALPPDGPMRAEVLFDDLPDRRWHGWRYAAFGPDGALYVAVGAACNVCAPNGLEGSILRFDPETWTPTVHATGVRNSVGMDFHPLTGELFFTDNGADWMGDDAPNDELNHAPEPGLHFGFPYFGGGSHRTDDFAAQTPPADTRLPVIPFNAHVAALGLRFYTGARFPAAYRNDALVAQHGSWNRSVPDGYRVMRVRFDDAGRALAKEVFAEGWLVDGESWGRPVDVAVLWDGTLLVSDDANGAIYRIDYAAAP